MRFITPALCSVLATAAAVGQSPHQPAEAITRGDTAWLRRAEGQQGGRARPEPVDAAIAAYREALENDPLDLEARWKLLRALYFKGDFVLQDSDEKLALFTESRELADEGRRQLEQRYELPKDSEDMDPAAVAEAVRREPLAAETYYWATVHWGLWGRERGKIAAARQGVAKKIRQFAQIVLLLDEELEEAGAHRILGRLHAEAPKLPFFTGWVDRDTAVAELRRALELAPGGLLTRLYLAEALLEYRPDHEDEALELLRDLAGRQPDPIKLVEQLRVIEDAKALLASRLD